MGRSDLADKPFFGQYLGLSLPLDQWRYQRLILSFAAFASAARAAISPTFPWCATLVLVKLAYLTLTKVFIPFAMEIIECSSIRISFLYCFNPKTAQMHSLAITFNKRN